VTKLFETGMVRGAQFSFDHRYRYSLWRLWDDSKPAVMFIGLNPSVADALTDDMTVRKCSGFAKRWEFGGIYICNLYSFVATHPQDLVETEYPLGPFTDDFIRRASESSDCIVACWGALESRYRSRMNWNTRIATVRELIRQPLMCLGTTADGSPRHPSRIGYDTQRELFG
jgi:hypothetical protein